MIEIGHRGSLSYYSHAELDDNDCYVTASLGDGCRTILILCPPDTGNEVEGTPGVTAALCAGLRPRRADDGFIGIEPHIS